MGSVKVRELVSGYWLRRWRLLGLAAALGAIGTAAVFALPASFRAAAVVAFRVQHPSADLVLPAVSGLPEDRVKALHSELLAEPLLRQVVGELRLYPGVRDEDARVAQLRSQLDIKVEGDDVFALEATSTDPKLAAAEANRLVGLYAEKVRSERLAEADQVEKVFGPELAELQKELEAQDGAIARFKSDHLGLLPEELDGNLRGYDRVTLLRERDVEASMEAQRRRSALLQEGHDDATALGRLRRRREDLAKELTDARSEWTEEHPEVLRLRRELGLVEGQIKVAETQQGEGALEARAVERQIEALQADEARLDSQGGDLRKRVDGTPAVADQLAKLGRARDAVQAKYQALLGRQIEAELSADLERRQQGDLFRVVSPAYVPSRPAKPDRTAGLILVWIAALALAALAGAAFELADDSIRGTADARERLGVPVLAVVPSFPPARLGTSGRR
ncbi:MAG: hypothetical protein ACYDCL_08035 [Myxococcales bacterium]